MISSKKEVVTVEKKWRMNAKKVSFAKSFPGCLKEWDAAVGKKIERVVSLQKEKTELVIFSDATFILVPNPEQTPALLIRVLLKAKPFLTASYKDAYETLNQLIESDQEMQRLARLENIMGAIQNNYSQIPELKTELKRFLKNVE